MGLAKKFQKDGLKVGYMKPLGKYPTTVGDKVIDSDAALMYEVLELDDLLEFVSPVIITQDIIARAYNGEDLKLSDKVTQAFGEVSRDKDLVLVSGPGSFSAGTLLGIPAKIVLGKRSVEQGKIEVQDRRTGEKRFLSVDASAEMLKAEVQGT